MLLRIGYEVEKMGIILLAMKTEILKSNNKGWGTYEFTAAVVFNCLGAQLCQHIVNQKALSVLYCFPLIRFTQETVLRDPIASLKTTAFPWWSVRAVTVSSKSKWKASCLCIASGALHLMDLDRHRRLNACPVFCNLVFPNISKRTKW